MWLTKIKSLFKRFVLVLAAALLAVGVLPTNPALAASYDELGVESRAQSYAFYRALLRCVEATDNVFSQEISGSAATDGRNASPANGNWFKEDAKATEDVWAGYGDNVKCNALLTTALREYWGFEEGEDYKFLDVNLNYTWNGIDTWERDIDQSPNGAAFTTAITRIDPSIVVAQPEYTYWLAKKSFDQNCSNFNKLGSYSELSTSQRNIVDKGDYIETVGTGGTAQHYMSEGNTVESVGGGYGAVTVTYFRIVKTVSDEGVEDIWHTAKFTVGTSAYSNRNNNEHEIHIGSDKFSCFGLIDLMNQNAPAYYDALAEDACTIGESNPLAGTPSGTSYDRWLGACKAGVKNRGNETFCQQTYYVGSANSPGLDAAEVQDQIRYCLAGQQLGISVGDDEGCTGPDCQPEATSSCSITGGLGWIVCPIIRFMASVNDTVYNVIDDMLLTKTESVASGGATYNAWQVMRNFANVGFVIFFLIIIFSQITSLGISNYGIKKLLPRLVIAAILVNISFFICQIAVDVSNILGGSIRSLLDNIAVFEPGGNTGTLAGGILAGTTAVAFGGITGAAAISGAAGLLLPVLLAAVLAVLVTVGILVVRQVFVILLVVVSPLAFLAMLLPNTEKLFKQWRKMFVAMLILYPMIALLFGGSALAADIIVGSSDDFLSQIMGVLITFVPLALTPTLMKRSLNAIPFVGDLANKLASKANSNLGKSFKPFIDKQKSRKEAGLNRWGGKRNEAKYFKRLRNVQTPEYEKYKNDKFDKNGNLLHRKGEYKKDKNGALIPKTGADGKPIISATRRRSGAQVVADSRRSLEKEVSVNKQIGENRWGERSLDSTARSARRAQSLLDTEKREGVGKQAIEKQYEGRLEVAKFKDTGTRVVYDRLQDATKTVATLEKEQEQRQLERTKSNADNTAAAAIGLTDLSGVAVADNVTVDQAARLQALGNAASLESGGGLKILHSNQQAAEQNIKEVEAGFEAELAERKKFGGDLFRSASQEAGSKATAAAAGKRFDSTMKEMATKDTDERKLRDRLLGTKPVPGENGLGKEGDADYEKARLEYEEKVRQFDAAEASGLRTALQSAATEDYIATTRIQQAEQDKTLGIDKEMLGEEPEGKALLRDATGVGTQERVRASAARRLQEDRRGDVTATEDRYDRVALTSEETAALQGIDSEGNELFENGVFIDTPENEKAWAAYESARAKLGLPVADKGETQTSLDTIQEEALARRTIKGGDEKENMKLANHLNEVRRQATEADEAAKADEAAAKANPRDTAAQEKAVKSREAADKARERSVVLSRAAAEQYVSNPKGLSPFLSTERREKMSHGDLDVSIDESVVETFGAAKIAASFVASWNINHYKTAATSLERPVEEILADMRRLADDHVANEHPELDRGSVEFKRLAKADFDRQAKSMSNARKAFDEAEDGPYNLDPRSKAQLDRMRGRLLELQEAEIDELDSDGKATGRKVKLIPPPDPIPGTTPTYVRLAREEGTGNIRRDESNNNEPIPWTEPPKPTP